MAIHEGQPLGFAQYQRKEQNMSGCKQEGIQGVVSLCTVTGKVIKLFTRI